MPRVISVTVRLANDRAGEPMIKVKGVEVFIVFVAFFVVLVIGSVAFTDLVEAGVGGLRSTLHKARRSRMSH